MNYLIEPAAQFFAGRRQPEVVVAMAAAYHITITPLAFAVPSISRDICNFDGLPTQGASN